MKKIGELCAMHKTEALITQSGQHRQESLLQISETDSTGLSLSLYSAKQATTEQYLQAVARLKAAFPKMTDNFFTVLTEQLVLNKVNSNRLRDAVDWLICNHKYKEISVADVMSYDSKIKLHTYTAVCDMVTSGRQSMQDFKRVKIKGRVFWALTSDLAIFSENLAKENI
jgi:hypothetical protein